MKTVVDEEDVKSKFTSLPLSACHHPSLHPPPRSTWMTLPEPPPSFSPRSSLKTGATDECRRRSSQRGSYVIFLFTVHHLLIRVYIGDVDETSYEGVRHDLQPENALVDSLSRMASLGGGRCGWRRS